MTTATTSGPTRRDPRDLARWLAQDAGISRFALPIILILFIVIFSIARPDTFFTTDNFLSILSLQSVLGILAIAALVPLVAGEFDLSVGANLGLGAVMVTGLTAKQGLPLWSAILLAMLICTLVGVFNGIFVAYLKLDAFIITLATSALATGAVTWYTEGLTIFEGVPEELLTLGISRPAGIPLPVIYLFVITILAWYLLAYTPVGRKLYALGGSKEASRLSGLGVERLGLLAFTTSGLLAGAAGVLQAAELGSGSPTVGPPFLLPAFAAVFLGATSIRPGTFNVVGTIVAVFVIAVGIAGLEQVGVPFYISPIFTGAVLILGVLATKLLQRKAS